MKFNIRDESGKFRWQWIIPLALGGVALAIGFALLFGWVVMLLWNWLMPELFGLKAINYWQAWGLLMLSQILFKSNFSSSSSSGGDKKKKRGCKGDTEASAPDEAEA